MKHMVNIQIFSDNCAWRQPKNKFISIMLWP